MQVLWHMEFHVDYSRFPSLGLGVPKDFTRSPFTAVGEQCRAYELWRRKQERVYHLHVYQSHFSDFAKYPHGLPTDFFDFQVNILQRRHQGFIDYRNEDEPIVLLSPGLMLDDRFDIEPLINRAMTENRMVCAVPEGGTEMPLSGMWVIPPSVQNEFCRPIPESIAHEYAGDDISYWWSLAERVTKPVLIESAFMRNILPQYAASSLAVPAVEREGKVLTKHSYPTWDENQFLDWMAHQKFWVSTTMRWCPHEYIMMKKCSGLKEQMNYLMAIDYLHRNVVVDQWRNRFQFATFVDGHKYWYCTVIDLLNRTSKELERRFFTEDGKDEHGRKIKVG